MKDIKRELEQVFRAAEAALARGADAKEFCALLYDPQAVVVGEGWQSAVRGMSALVPEVAVLMKEWGVFPKVVFTLVDPMITVPPVATTFVDVKVAPNDSGGQGGQYRVMYAWKQGEAGWRVAMEMFGGGVF